MDSWLVVYIGCSVLFMSSLNKIKQLLLIIHFLLLEASICSISGRNFR